MRGRPIPENFGNREPDTVRRRREAFRRIRRQEDPIHARQNRIPRIRMPEERPPFRWGDLGPVEKVLILLLSPVILYILLVIVVCVGAAIEEAIVR